MVLKSDFLLLKLYIQPKASHDRIVGRHGDEIKVAITALPTDGQANAHLVKFLSKQFAVPKNQVIIERGVTSRHKLIRILHPKRYPADFLSLEDNSS